MLFVWQFKYVIRRTILFVHEYERTKHKISTASEEFNKNRRIRKEVKFGTLVICTLVNITLYLPILPCSKNARKEQT